MRGIACTAALVLLSCICFAQDAKKDPVSLFDGKSLKGWKVIGCQVEVTEDGCMLMKAGNGVVRPERTFKDYVLELDWKALNKERWDSGIYFRCQDPPAGRPWPTKYQVNLLKGQEGNVQELKGAQSKGLTKANEWNHFKLTVKGTTCALEINGQPAWMADGLENPDGFISLQAEVPGGGQFLFKNITIVELKD